MALLLVIDDHPLFRAGFAAMAAAAGVDWSLDFAGSGAEGLAVLATAALAGQAPAIAIVDLGLPDMHGIELVRRIVADHGVPCVVMSGQDDAAARIRARAAGARGFIAKTSAAPHMKRVIETVLTGLDAWTDDERELAMPSLTPRQAEILALLADGHGNKEIRYRLGIAERTVRAHLTELFQQLGAHSRAQAVLRARALGLVG